MINEIDVKNIRKELIARKAMAYKFESGGTIEEDVLRSLNEGILEANLKEYENADKIKAFTELKQLVQEAFDKYGKEDDNMIPLDMAHFIDHYPVIYPVYEEWCWQIFWGNEEWNTLYKPIGWDESDIETWDQVMIDKYSYLLKISKRITYLLNKIVKTTNIEEVGDMDATNDEWYTVTAVTKNLHFVSFAIRSDGLPLSNYDYYHNEDLNVYEHT